MEGGQITWKRSCQSLGAGLPMGSVLEVVFDSNQCIKDRRREIIDTKGDITENEIKKIR